MKKLLLYSAVFMFSLNTFYAQVNTKYTATQGFVAHEWGTFTSLHTSDGAMLPGLQQEEEHLPEFVQDLCFCPTVRTRDFPGHKGYYPVSLGTPSLVTSNLKNVTIKMETPVLYFYSSGDQEKKIIVDVKFNNGSISQWYPYRSAGERYDQMLYLGWISPTSLEYLSFEQATTVDFKNPRQGSIQWKATVLPLNTTLKYTNAPWLETPIWVAPRATASNLLKADSTGQVEKFLFYRGIGNFKEPIWIEFNKQGNLVISNRDIDSLNYVMVYEKKKDQKAKIWWSGAIKKDQKKVVTSPKNAGKTSPEAELETFVTKLVEAGLYEDEARAMLKTWEKSYFEHDGLKVFWIVPPKFTEQTLPLSIQPKPDAVKRVLVGRSEILTPEFEKELVGLSPDAFYQTYNTDRFVLAYSSVREGTLTSQWTSYNVLTNDDGTEIREHVWSDIQVFPNPVTGNLTIALHEGENLSAKLYSETGALTRTFDALNKGENVLLMEDLPNGVYVLKLAMSDGKVISKKLVKAKP